MTIAAGFIVKEGLLLFADSQYSADGKMSDQKLFTEYFTGAVLSFAITGDIGWARTTVDDAFGAVHKLEGNEELSVDRIKQKVRAARGGQAVRFHHWLHGPHAAICVDGHGPIFRKLHYQNWLPA